MITTTILICIVMFLLVFVLTLERRTRGILNNRYYHIQTVLPSSKLILSSKRYTLFRLPTDLSKGFGTISFCGTGDIVKHSNVLMTLYGVGDEPIKVFECNSTDKFKLDTHIHFRIDDNNVGHLLTLKIETFNPGPHNILDDMIVTLNLRTGPYFDTH